MCAHNGLHRGKEWKPLRHGWFRPKFMWALPPQGSWGGAPDCRSLLSAHQLSTFKRKNSPPLRVRGGSNKLPLFLPTLKHHKKQPWAGDCFLGKEPQVLSATVGRSNCIYALGPPLCVSFEMHTHAQTTRSTHTNTSVNPIEVQSLLSGLYSI